MPNDCECDMRIGADAEHIKLLCDNEFSFEKLQPFPEGSKDDWYEWNCENWGTKWDRYDYKLVRRGEMGMEVRFKTAWTPPLEFCKHLVQTYHDIWIKCDWYDEGGAAGVFVVRWDQQENKVHITETEWDDWCIEEWAMRMRPVDS